MKYTILKPTDITVTHVKLRLPVRYEEEDIPNDFPRRFGEVWDAMVNIDTGEIQDWPSDPRFEKCVLQMKVCDEGVYTLYSYFGDHWDEVAKLDQGYVPHGVVPGEYGDYVHLDIQHGKIVNWPKKPNLKAFFNQKE